MMKALQRGFQKTPGVVRGDVAAEIPPSFIVIAPARAVKKSEKQKQQGLF